MKPPAELLDRVPPHDPSAEQQVLGSLILDPRRCEEVLSTLKASDFYRPMHALVYQTIAGLYDAREPVDVVTVARRLKANPETPDKQGVEVLLAELVASVAVPAHAAAHARVVARYAKYRALIHAATDLLRDSYAAEDPPDEIAAAAEAALSAVETSEYLGEPVPIADALVEACDRMDAILQRRRQAGLLTGFSQFDMDIGGLFAGELFVLAARPGIGKTALATQIAHHVAAAGRLVYFASLEMSACELATRIVCGLGGVSSKRIRTGTITPEEVALLAEASNTLGQAKMLLHDRPGLSLLNIRRSARRLQSKGLSLIVVDYLQRITPADRRLQRYEQVADIVRGLKTLARECEVPVLCLVQLGREAEKEKPSLRHLRESGDIEAEADVVAFLLRNVGWSKDEPAEPWRAVLAVEKNRNGEVGTFRLKWEPEKTRFADPYYEEFA